ncbi:MAG: hypothetical protein WAM14_05065 [Candidatus Nitrosopolaris sp.]
MTLLLYCCTVSTTLDGYVDKYKIYGTKAVAIKDTYSVRDIVWSQTKYIKGQKILATKMESAF